MKRILSLMLFSILSIFFIGNSAKVDAATTNSINYTANLKSGLPSDWKVYEKCNVANTTTQNSSGSLKVSHSGSTAAATYHGALLQINPNGLNNVGDFTLQMDFKVNSYENTDRWIGVMYHTQIDSSNNLTGYMMNYRVSGKSAQSTITLTDSGAIFNDSLVKERAGNPLSDNKVHKLKIECIGTKVSHYMDDILIVSYDYRNYSSGLSKIIHTSGGFALIVNRMSITINSLTITGENPSATELDTFLNVSYNPSDNFVGEVGAVINVGSKSDLQSLVNPNGIKPSTAILTIDENMNVCDENGNSLGHSVRDVYLGYLYQRIIPAVYLKTQKIAEKFVEYFYKNLNIFDMSVVSDNPQIVKYVREEIFFIRGIVDYSKKTVEKGNWQEVVETTNESMANVVILNPKDASYDAIRYIQARFKTVWIDNKSMERIDIAEQILNGAYGIIYDDFEEVYSVLKSYSDSGYLMNRMPYNIAHRGLCLTVAENSLEGYIESYKNGATHIEIDIRLTKDNKVVVMHDATINRTTNGTGDVNQMTLSEIKKYKIDSYYDHELGSTPIPNSNGYTSIPSLEEVFQEFQNKDTVLVVEIKSYEEELIRQLKVLIDKYNMSKNVVVITFSNDQIVNMKNILPNIPTATLNTGTVDTFKNTLMTLATMNCGYDGGNWISSEDVNRKLALRGYSTWYWTYQKETNIWVGLHTGTLGITNNEANKIADYALRIEFEKNPVVDSSYDNVEGNIICYNQKYNKNKTVTIAEKVEYEGYAHVIYKYTHQNEFGSYVVFSDRMPVLSKALSDEIKNLNSLLDKDITSLTESDAQLLERYNSISKKLEEDKVPGIDADLIKEKLDSYKAVSKNETDNQQNTNDIQVVGCRGSFTTSLFGILTLAGTAVIFKKRKNRF